MKNSLTTFIKKEIQLNEALQHVQRIADMDTITYPDGKVINVQTDVLEKYRIACMYIFSNFSYFAPAIKSLVPIITNAIDTMATDGIRIFMNPRFTAELTDNQVIFVILHECMHCILNHVVRERAAGFSDHRRANIAADYECNGILEGDGLVKQGTTKSMRGYIDSKYDGWAFERIYADKNMDMGGGDPDDMGDPNGGQGGQSDQNGQGQSGNQQDRGPDYKAGYEQAIKDYNSGKLKI